MAKHGFTSLSTHAISVKTVNSYSGVFDHEDNRFISYFFYFFVSVRKEENTFLQQ